MNILLHGLLYVVFRLLFLFVIIACSLDTVNGDDMNICDDDFICQFGWVLGCLDNWPNNILRHIISN